MGPSTRARTVRRSGIKARLRGPERPQVKPLTCRCLHSEARNSRHKGLYALLIVNWLDNCTSHLSASTCIFRKQRCRTARAVLVAFQSRQTWFLDEDSPAEHHAGFNGSRTQLDLFIRLDCTVFLHRQDSASRTHTSS